MCLLFRGLGEQKEEAEVRRLEPVDKAQVDETGILCVCVELLFTCAVWDMIPKAGINKAIKSVRKLELSVPLHEPFQF